MKKKEDLFFAPSLYSLFLYMLINNDWEKSDYVLLDSIPLIIHKRLKESVGADVYVYKYRKKGLSLFNRIILTNKDYWEFKKIYNNRKYERVWGNDELYASFLFRKQGIRIIEDGIFNSKPRNFFQKRNWKIGFFLLRFWFYDIFCNYIPYGWDKKVQYIYHTTKIKLPREIAHKGINVDINENWQKKTAIQRNAITSFFGISDKLIKKLDSFSSVLVTQPLPMSDEEKISIYRKMIDGIDESKLLIKTHYAETTDYKKHFPNAEVVSIPVPMQLFNLIGYLPKKIMTISSSAILPFVKEGVIITFLGTEIDPRIVSAYGVVRLEDIIK